MTISFPFAILNLFLLNSYHGQAFFIPSSPLSSTTFRECSGLNARPNRAVDVADPYASLINKVSTPTPEPPQPATVPDAPADAATIEPSSLKAIANQVSDLVDQVNQAANTAVEASNQASQVGSAPSAITTDVITSATAAVTDTSTASSTSTINEQTEKVPSLLDYFRQGNIKEDLKEVQTITKQTASFLNENAKGTISNLNDNVVAPVSGKVSEAKVVIGGSSTGLNEITQSTKSLISGAAGAAGDAAASASSSAATTFTLGPDFDLKSLYDSLQLEAYGAWYLAGATFIYAVTAKESGKSEATKKFEEELAEAKEMAEEAAKAAGVAAEGAKMAKELVDSIDDIPSVEGNKNIGEVLLETSRMEELRVENELMQIKIERLQAKNAEQEILIAQLIPKNGETATINGENMMITDIPLVKEIMERDPEEDAKFIQIIKEIDDENAKAAATAIKTKTTKKKKKKASKKKVTAKVKKAKSPGKKKKKAVKKVKKAIKEEVDSDFKKIEAAEGYFMDAISETVTENGTEEKNGAMNDVDKIMAVIADSEAEEKNEKMKNEILDAIAEVSKEEVEEVDTKTKVTKKKRKKKKATKKVKTIKAVKAVKASTTETVNPWGTLKQSTLQRKTIAQLTAYLEERKVDVAGLSKKDLVGAIQDL